MRTLDTPSAADKDRRVSVADLMRREGYTPGPELEWNSPSDHDPPTRPITSVRSRRSMIAVGAAVAGSALATVLVIATTGPATTTTAATDTSSATPPVAGPALPQPTPAAPTGAPAAPGADGGAALRAVVIEPKPTTAPDRQEDETAPAPSTTPPAGNSGDTGSDDQNGDRGGNGNNGNRGGGNGNDRPDKDPPGLANGLADAAGDLLDG